MTTTTGYALYPVGTVIRRRAGGQQYRVVHPPEWLISDAVAAINVDTGVWSTHDRVAVKAFYEVVSLGTAESPADVAELYERIEQLESDKRFLLLRLEVELQRKLESIDDLPPADV